MPAGILFWNLTLTLHNVSTHVHMGSLWDPTVEKKAFGFKKCLLGSSISATYENKSNQNTSGNLRRWKINHKTVLGCDFLSFAKHFWGYSKYLIVSIKTCTFVETSIFKRICRSLHCVNTILYGHE